MLTFYKALFSFVILQVKTCRIALLDHSREQWISKTSFSSKNLTVSYWLDFMEIRLSFFVVGPSLFNACRGGFKL